jgi:hypothetical protein
MALYDEPFWKFACIVSGWGMPLRLQTSLARDASVKPWGAIARTVVKDARLFRGETVDELKKYALMKSRSMLSCGQSNTRLIHSANPSSHIRK